MPSFDGESSGTVWDRERLFVKTGSSLRLDRLRRFARRPSGSAKTREMPDTVSADDFPASAEPRIGSYESLCVADHTGRRT